MRLSREELKGLMKNKLIQAGLREDHADQTAEILTWAHERGFASHGAVRVEYYCERIFKGGITHEPNITWNQTGPCSGIMDGDNGIGYWVATKATEKAIEMAKENGVAIVGMANVSHTGAIGYYTEMCAKEGLSHSASQIRWQYHTAEQSLIMEQTRFHLLARQQTIVMLYLIWLQQFRLGEKSWTRDHRVLRFLQTGL